MSRRRLFRIPRVFISYRRNHPSAALVAIMDRKLAIALGRRRVFLDLEHIEGGDAYLQRIDAAIARSDVVLVAIFDGWADIAEDGKRRLDNENDVLRHEIEFALSLGKRVIPLLLGTARMPSEKELPGKLSALSARDAMRIRLPPDLDVDVANLRRTIDPFYRLRRAMVVGALAVAVSAAAWIWFAPPREVTVAVPAGRFLMGCNANVDTECDLRDERPMEQAETGAFAMDLTEVTVADYAVCVRARGCDGDGLTEPSYSFTGRAPQADAEYCNWSDRARRSSHPMNCVTWYEADAYCRWARSMRLPTEGEWEKAARGADGFKYPWGNEGFAPGSKPVANIADESAQRDLPQAWRTPEGYAKGYDDGGAATAPVGSFAAGRSPYGALDMVGNVWEWVDGGDGSGQLRVARGGSFSDTAKLARASARAFFAPSTRSPLLGFRCARSR